MGGGGFFEEFGDEGFDFGEGAVAEGFFVDDEDVVDGVIVVMRFFIKADGFVEAAADAVTADCGFTNFFRDNNGEALEMASVFHIDEGEFFPAEGFSVAIDVIYAAARVETVTTTEH